MTLSLGVASMIPDPRLTGEALLKCADRALYLAKTEGRDRVHVASEKTLKEELQSQAPEAPLLLLGVLFGVDVSLMSRLLS